MAYDKEYYQKNKEKELEKNKEYKIEHKDFYKEYYKKYYQKHKKEMTENSKRWGENNKEKKYQIIQKSRRKRVEKLREQGITNAWNVVLYGKEPKYKVV